ILSNQTGYPKFSFFDFTDEMKKFSDVWGDLGYKFSNIHSGFLGNKMQVDIVIDFIKKFKTENANIIIDTVMGDNGKLYPIFDEEYVDEMRQLSNYATIMTPNVTELFLLANKKISYCQDKIIDAAKSLAGENTKQIIVTGILEEDKIYNYVIDFCCGGEIFKTSVPFNNKSYSGTGDIFSSIVSACIAKGKTSQFATEFATDFIYKAVSYTNKHGTNPNDGVLFENFIKELTEI
ncbi:MAG: bifunctional hydroxymethylpyrimidine kinase/phosphomethylpyrimidine kinase, partial [Oscillospiraceae bacterium]